MSILLPSFDEIRFAAERINPHIHKTPVLNSHTLNRICDADLYFKCENFQRMGAFKMRGAMNAVLQLSISEREKGVATHSSGNFAQALSLAAKNLNLKAYIVMPRNASEVKKRAVQGYGGEIIECEPTLAAREKSLNEVVARTGARFIHPYNDIDVIVGNSTAAMELFIETADLDYILAPVGGGGLLSGTALCKKFFAPDVKVIGAEPKGADDASRSFHDGVIYPSVDPQTVCDGLLTQLSERTFDIIRKNVDDIIPASEESIISAMRMIWERMKVVVEPAAAVPLAIVFENRRKFINKKLAIILTGGNVDLTKLPWNKIQ